MKKPYFIFILVFMIVGTFAGVLAQNNLKDLPSFKWIINTAAETSLSNNAVITVNEGQTATNNGIFDNLADGVSASASAGTINTFAVPVKLSAPFNTGSYEAFLRFSADGLRAYFSGIRAGGLGLQDIFMTERASVNAPWGSAVNLGSAFNTNKRDYLGVESPDGLTLYFDQNEGDLAKAVRPSINTPWTDSSVVFSSAEFVNINVANSFDYHPTLTPDGLTLIFQNNTPSNITLKISTRTNTSAAWSAPTPLSNINSGTLTNNPLLMPDGLTLYFCSNRAGGLGGTDIYKAVRPNSGTSWTDPSVVISAIPEANSNSDDASPFVGQNTALYFASNRGGGVDDYANYYIKNQWTWSLATEDSAADSQTVTINAVDDNGGVNMTTFNLIVNNVAPTATFTNGGAVSEGSTGSVSFSNSFDPSSADTTAGFCYAYDFDNDGTFEIGDGTYNGSVIQTSAVVPADFLANPGTRIIRGRIIDKDAGFSDYTTTITITPLIATITIAHSASADFSPNNRSIALNATVTASSIAVNTGTVQFTVKDNNGNVIGATVISAVAGGTASATYIIPGGTSAQNLIITAEYSNGGMIYQISSGTNLLTISKATPLINWATNQADITYGTPLSATQLNATSSIPGNFVYAPSAGTILNAVNNQPLSVNFIPDDTTNYNSATATATINVLKAALTIKADDKSRTYGDAPVTFTVTPTGLVNGDLLSNLNGTLSFNFSDSVNLLSGSYPITPTGLTSNNYNIAFQNGTLTVAKADLTVTADDKSRLYGAANPPLTGIVTGIKNGENITASYSTAATQTSNAGDYAIVPQLSGATLSNYEITAANGTLTIAKAPQTIVWSNPVDIVYGTPLSAVQLNAAVLVVGPAPHGSVTYTPAAGTMLNAGTGQTLAVNAAETNNYLPAAAFVYLNVMKAPSVVTATAPASVVNGGNAVLSAALTGVANAPLGGRSLTLSIGSGTGLQSCSAITDVNGAASCTITGVNQPVGANLPVSSNFAGDDNYLASSGSTTTLVSAFPTLGTGVFVIGDSNATIGQSVTFWGSQWARKNSLTGGAAPNSFKGFVNRTASTPPACGLTWTADPGNSSNPPETVPAYLAVIVSSSIAKQGSVISGDTPKIVIVKTNSGYGSNPGNSGTGTVVSVLCQ